MYDITEEKVKIILELENLELRGDKLNYLDSEIKKNERLLRNFLNKKKVKNNPYKNGTIAMGNGFTFPEEDFYNGIIEYLRQTKLFIAETPATMELRKEKLKWLGKPEQFGYIFTELAKKGFIELPSSKGQGSYAKYAKICYELFEFIKETTPDNLKRALNPDKNRLSESNRAKIAIPDINAIS